VGRTPQTGPNTTLRERADNGPRRTAAAPTTNKRAMPASGSRVPTERIPSPAHRTHLPVTSTSRTFTAARDPHDITYLRLIWSYAATTSLSAIRADPTTWPDSIRCYLAMPHLLYIQADPLLSFPFLHWCCAC
jgi:hypothetical protein